MNGIDLRDHRENQKAKRSWQGKSGQIPMEPKVFETPKRDVQKNGVGEGKMVVPAQVEETNDAASPKGKLVTPSKSALALAAEACGKRCPARAPMAFYAGLPPRGEESQAEGKKKITPGGGTFETCGALHPKYPGGGELQAKPVDG